ncbi:2'-5' RNA ligase family protein [Planomonospora sp. ID82291]|uniref:2'-5' RNA ligase family protein n=1 Tax=Planomonospora sp. ID82291 TaxID=2738136 RepID=UPI0018C41861|nr:2'-5' RNA ligase family protein [Planomonospora sp. ID82291]MBG0818976.1 2'-5' RNA ligase family protein [Planomonospora sp. ID82291]
MTVKLERKSVAVSPGAALADAPKGTVTCLVAITGVEDNVGDVIMPGAFSRTLALRKPKGVFSHDTTAWVSRAEVVEEWLPGDPRLPKETKDGHPWPAGAGALFVRARFNLKTKAGGEAYERVAFYSESNEQEWSIGYSVPDGGARRDPKTGVRRIYDLDLYEFSPVLFGAASQTMTLSVKSGLPRTAGGTPWDDLLDGYDDAEAAAPGSVEEPRAMVSLTVPAPVAEAVAVDGGLPAAELHVTLAYLGQGVDEDMLAEAALAVEKVAAQAGPLAGTIGGIGVFPESEDGIPAWAPVDVPGLVELRQKVVEALDEAGIWYAVDHGFAPHMTLTYLQPGEALPAPVPVTPVEFGTITLAVEDDHEDFPLTGPAAGEEPPSGPAAPFLDDLDGTEELEGLEAKHAPGWQTKAGRVLSDRNLKRMRQAVDILTEIMKEAGGWDDPREHDPARRQPPEMPPEPTILPDSTAPSALPTELKMLTVADLAAGRAILESVGVV